MKLRPFLLAGLLLSLAAPSFGAVTSNQLITLTTADAGLPYRQRVQFQLIVTAENIVSESAATAKHTSRAALASQILNNPDTLTTQFAKAVAAQLVLNSTNMVTVAGVSNADVDTSDATIATDISAVFNAFLPQP